MKSAKILAIAAVVVALPFSFPFSLQAQSNGSQSASANYAGPASAGAGQQEAMHMVPATGALLNELDASKIGPGYEMRVRLTDTVHLNNGPKLPSGTILVGTIAKDDQEANGVSGVSGVSKVAVQFTQAKLKDGKVVPIKATIVRVAKPEPSGSLGYGISAGAPDDWTDKTLRVDQIGVASHVDLHSTIGSSNSGVFVSTNNHDVKIPAGSGIELAIAGA